MQSSRKEVVRMAVVIVSDDCQKGEHEKCLGSGGAEPGSFGGFVCICRCHNTQLSFDEFLKKKREIEERTANAPEMLFGADEKEIA